MFQCPHGLELLPYVPASTAKSCIWFQCPHGLELLQYFAIIVYIPNHMFQCPHGLELLLPSTFPCTIFGCFNALTGLSCYPIGVKNDLSTDRVSMPSRAWVVTRIGYTGKIQLRRFNALTGLSCYVARMFRIMSRNVSMPSRAWVVTARMSNILNFLWYFLCIPAIYKCILAYLSIFFNQLSKFLRCESPSTFLGTCLSHHSFIWW